MPATETEIEALKRTARRLGKRYADASIEAGNRYFRALDGEATWEAVSRAQFEARRIDDKLQAILKQLGHEIGKVIRAEVAQQITPERVAEALAKNDQAGPPEGPERQTTFLKPR